VAARAEARADGFAERFALEPIVCAADEEFGSLPK
jgi:hypothetical protein